MTKLSDKDIEAALEWARERASGHLDSIKKLFKPGAKITLLVRWRDPHFYSGTFCVRCRAHFPVGENGEFVWDDGSKVGA